VETSLKWPPTRGEKGRWKGDLPGGTPEFSELIEAVREWIAKVIGKVTVRREVRVWHPAIDRLLKEDEKETLKNLAASLPEPSLFL
jgi:hypothetical protein